MVGELVGQAVFFRHGQTQYTDIYPDLTEEGRATIAKTAQEIRQLVNGSGMPEFVTSPLARARGSIAIVANTLGYEGIVKQEDQIRAADIKDKKASWRIFYEHIQKGGSDQLSRAYFEDLRYEDSSIIEPRSQIANRFYTYLSQLANRLLANPHPQRLVVHASHYEVISHVVEALFELIKKEERPLLHGEVVLIKFFRTPVSTSVFLEATLRGKTATAIFDLHELFMKI